MVLQDRELPPSRVSKPGAGKTEKARIRQDCLRREHPGMGHRHLAALKEKAPVYGINVVAEVMVEPKTKDLTIQARQLKDSGARHCFVPNMMPRRPPWRGR